MQLQRGVSGIAPAWHRCHSRVPWRTPPPAARPHRGQGYPNSLLPPPSDRRTSLNWGSWDASSLRSKYLVEHYREERGVSSKAAQRDHCSPEKVTEVFPNALTKCMNPAAVSHVLINIEHRFTSLMELLEINKTNRNSD